MFGRTTTAIGSALLLATVIAGTGCLDPSSSAHTTGTPSASGARAQERGCAERVESQTITPKRGRDTVIGPIAFYRLKAGFRPDAQLQEGAPRFVPIKALALVESGARVTLVVPSSQRAWMRLFYTGDSA